MFIGADIDACEEAGKLGIRRERTANYVHDDVGTQHIYAEVAKAVCSVMRAPSAAKVDSFLEESSWTEEIDRDFKERGTRRF